ncbi:hypothetical protein CVCC1112_718 [Paenarthrobacter nicotinovorans]|nr:hypothetical protein CVCC1112_718 [Paenarthrobacter nicotinovorans]
MSFRDTHGLAVYRPGKQTAEFYALPPDARYDEDGVLQVSGDGNYYMPHRTMPEKLQKAMEIVPLDIKAQTSKRIDLLTSIPNLGSEARVLGAIFDPQLPQTALVTIDADGTDHQVWAVPIDGSKAELRYSVKSSQDSSLGRSTLDGSAVDTNKESASKGHPTWEDLPEGGMDPGGIDKNGKGTQYKFTLRGENQIAVWQKASGTTEVPDQGWSVKETVTIPVAASQLNWAMPLYK